jgi:FkbM family methyltransferase
MSQLLNRLMTKARAIRRTQRYRETLAGLGAEFTCDPARPGAELVTVRGLTFSIKSEEDLFILTEIFDRQCYNFGTTGETVVIDVGMNIGVASLFFASDPNVTRVFSFEPFRRTYELACANLRWNPTYAAKITAKNFGLAGCDGVEELPYIEERKGSVGINGLPRSFTPAREDLHMERIELCEAATVLRPIFDNHADSQIVLKMDCEGSEYGIFKNLDDAGLLGRFQAIMLEWHNHGPHALRQMLEKHGYSVFTFGDQPSPIGMLYAINVRAGQRRNKTTSEDRLNLCPVDASLNSAQSNVAELAKL